MNTATTATALAMLLATSACAHTQWRRARAGEARVPVYAGEGVGNVKLGMGKARVRRRLGEPALVDHFADGELYWTYPQLGLSVKFQENELDTIHCYSGVHGGYETRDYQPFPGATVEGISLDSSQRQVLETYGRPALWESDDKAPIPATWLSYSQGLGFCFTSRSEEMVYLYVD